VIAVCNIRAEPHYRREAFERGLQRAGYLVLRTGSPKGPQDLLVQWNRKPSDEQNAARWERDGGTVLVCENGYIGQDSEGRQLYAISCGQHNGAGWFPVGNEDRFSALGIELEPWRTPDPSGDVLICAQRGIGSRLMASPANWQFDAMRKLSGASPRKCRVRQHPGNHAPTKSLADDLQGVWACAIWSSSSGVKALTMGVPVLYDAPHWIAYACARRLADVERPIRDDEARKLAMHHVAHGQWSVAEIETGEPFARIDAGIRRAWECRHDRLPGRR
jgi:hypothetical protein